MYKEYIPDIRLQNLVECFWVSNDLLPDMPPQRILPDGCVDIIFSFSGDNSNFLSRQGQPFIVGTMTYSFESVHTFGIVEMIGIRFRPAGITAFTRIPINEFTNSHIDLVEVDTLFGSEFYEELPNKQTYIQRIKHIQQYLLKHMFRAYELDAKITYASSLILQNNGQLLIGDIVNSVCLSERQFERKFKSAVGVSPKTFSKVIRFRHACIYLKQNPKESLYGAAISCGYYDHSHLIRDFKRFGRELPKEVI